MSKIIVEERDALWLVKINAPERRNALGTEVVRGLQDVADRVAKEKMVRCIVISGAGEKAFCAGADLKERKDMPEPEVRTFVSNLNRMMSTIANSPKVWIAAMHGACLGGGMELALTTDLRVARTDVSLGLPEVRLGILPGAGGTQRLPRLIGMARAKQMILTGMRFGAEEALRLGVINQVAEDHEAAALALAEEVCKCAPISLVQAKRAIEGGWDMPMTEGLAFERSCYDVTIPTTDRVEALRAFAEKRPPNFKGE